MRSKWPAWLLAGLLAGSALANDGTVATVAATYQPADRKLLASSFVAAVNTWLHRYERRLLKEESSYVRMQVRYDYVYDLELTILDDRFEIAVTGSERAEKTSNGQRNANNLAAGILERMELRKRRRNENKERWSR
jgi:hypothetical protein